MVQLKCKGCRNVWDYDSTVSSTLENSTLLYFRCQGIHFRWLPFSITTLLYSAAPAAAMHYVEWNWSSKNLVLKIEEVVMMMSITR